MLKINDDSVYTSDIIKLLAYQDWNTSNSVLNTDIPDIGKVICDGHEVWKAADWNSVNCSASKTSDVNTSISIGETRTFYMAANIIPSCKRFLFKLNQSSNASEILPIYFKYLYKGNEIYTRYMYLDNQVVSETYTSNRDCFYYKSDTEEYVKIGEIVLGQGVTPEDNVIPYTFKLDNSGYSDLPIYSTWNKIDVEAWVRYVPNTYLSPNDFSPDSISIVFGVSKTFKRKVTSNKIHAMSIAKSTSPKKYLFDISLQYSNNNIVWISFEEGAEPQVIVPGKITAEISKVEEGAVEITFRKISTSVSPSTLVDVKSIFVPGMNET